MSPGSNCRFPLKPTRRQRYQEGYSRAIATDEARIRRTTPDRRDRRWLPVRRCAFSQVSSRALRRGTRVRGIWDQNPDKQPIVTVNGRDFGKLLTDFNYGLEFLRDFAAAGVRLRKIGLDEWIDLHSTAAGSIDEDGCYADAGFTDPQAPARRTARM